MKCWAENCEDQGRGLVGLCDKHSQRFRKHGSPDIVKKVRGARTLQDVLEPMIDKSGPCWNWTGGTKANRQGVMSGFFQQGGRNHAAHRAAYQVYVGPIPKGARVFRSCENPLCCRPDHLYLRQPGICARCSKQTTAGKSGLCPICLKDYHRENRSKNAPSVRAAQIRYRYGVEPEYIDALLVSQGGLCAICRTRKATHIDHCHESGMVRGILCPPCNKGIGHFEDDEGRLMAAAEYLRSSRGAESDGS